MEYIEKIATRSLWPALLRHNTALCHCHDESFFASKTTVMTNLISAQIPDEDLESVIQAINTIHRKLPFLVKLSPAESKTMAMLQDGRYPFASKAIDYASREQSICPNPQLLEEAKKDIGIFDKLQTVDRELSRLSEMVADTRKLAGAELYEFARVIYKMAKISASLGTPGTQSIVDDLGQLFANNGKSNPARTAEIQ